MKECPECGKKTLNGSGTCSSCGMVVGEKNILEQEALVEFRQEGNHNKHLILVDYILCMLYIPDSWPWSNQ